MRGNEECKTLNVNFSQFQFILSVISTDFLFPLFMELHLHYELVRCAALLFLDSK